MGLLDEPRYILDHCVEWYEMPEEMCIRDRAYVIPEEKDYIDV